jgi:hypothetical protein
LRADYAANHEVCGSLAVPVFGTNGGSCCAVLEIITTKEKSDFDHEMDSVCMALQVCTCLLKNLEDTCIQ